MSKEELERHLDHSECPYLEIKLIKDHNDPRRSKGYAFVEYKNISTATKAKQRFNGMELDGKTLRVDYSVTNNRKNGGGGGAPFRGRSRSPPRRSSYGRRYSPPRKPAPKYREAEPNHCLAIFNLPKRIDENKLTSTFDKFGHIEKVKVVRDHATGESKRYGFIWFEHTRNAVNAFKDMNGYNFSSSDEEGIRVDYSLNEDRGGRSRRSPAPRSYYRSRSRSLSR